jgi:hypothetical protein
MGMDSPLFQFRAKWKIKYKIESLSGNPDSVVRNGHEKKRSCFMDGWMDGWIDGPS